MRGGSRLLHSTVHDLHCIVPPLISLKITVTGLNYMYGLIVNWMVSNKVGTYLIIIATLKYIDTVIDLQSYPPVHYMVNYTVKDTYISVNICTTATNVIIGEIQPHDVIIATVAPVNIVGTGSYISTTGIY